MRLGRWSLLAFGIAAAACASTIGPVVPSIQVLVVLDSLDDTLRIIPVDSPNVMHKIPLNLAASDKHALAVRGQYAVISSGANALSIDLVSGHLVCTSPGQLNGAPIGSLAFDDNGLVYAAVPATNRVPYFDPTSPQSVCQGGSGYVRGGPTGFAVARSNMFVVARNPAPCDQSSCDEHRSWLATSVGQPEPPNNTPLRLTDDSIPLSLPGNAQGAVVASDGFIYVLDAGSGRQPNARLSQVDPVLRGERRALVGFGTLPQYIATDGDRVFVVSATEGLMVYNTRTSQLEHDANTAIPLFGGTPHGLAADDIGRVYVLIAGSCSPAAPGSVQVYGPNLVSQRRVTVGRCPVAIGVTDIPSTSYHFDH